MAIERGGLEDLGCAEARRWIGISGMLDIFAMFIYKNRRELLEAGSDLRNYFFPHQSFDRFFG